MQARSHAYRRPSTASGRLSSEAAATYHRPSPPKALAANRSEYWGTHASVENHDHRSQGYQQQQQYVSRRPQRGRGVRVRERPLSAGCHPTSSPSGRSSTIGAATATIAVEACTRNRAGIVRGGGREGRAAPPPTPPSPRSSSSSSHLVTTPPAAPQHRQQRPIAVAAALYSPKSTPRIPPHEMRRRRPSTAGAKRNPAAEYDDGGYGNYHYHEYDNEPTKRVPAGFPPTMSSGFSGVRRSTAGVCAGDDGGLHTDFGENDSAASQAQRPAAIALSHPPTTDAGADMIQLNCVPPQNTNQSTIYRQGSRGATRTMEVAGRRRRPASAAPPRSRANNVCVEDLNGRGEGNGGSFDADWRMGTTRGRTIVRGGGRGMQRPRSASASTGKRAQMNGVDGTQQLRADRRSFGAFAPVSAGAVRSSLVDDGRAVGHGRPQSASATSPAVVPSFVVSEKQVLRFFGHLTEGEKFV